MDRDGKPKSNLIIPSSLLTDLDRRSQLRNENRSFQGRGGRQVNTSPEPILSIRSKSRLDEARRSKRNARSSAVSTRHWRIYRNQYIYPCGFESGECARLVNRCIPRIILGLSTSLRSFDRLSSKPNATGNISRALSTIKVPPEGTVPSRGTRDQTPPPGDSQRVN